MCDWLLRREQIELEAVVQARIVREANLVIETNALEPDQFVQVMKERVCDLEGAD